MPPLLTIRDLRVRYGPLEALHGVSLTVAAGRITVVTGRNGAGKTTLLRAVAGTVRPAAGRLIWHDTPGTTTDLTRATVARRAAAGIILISDDRAVFSTLTVRENLTLFAGRAPIDPALAAFPHLRALLNRRALLLSGGEQQMLALSRAVLAPWRLLLVDELAHGLAPALADTLHAALADLVAAHPDRSVLLAEPGTGALPTSPDHTHTLRHGEITTDPGSDCDGPDSLAP